ncbi:MAG TPA: type II secretion system F family protein [Sideroxyarcus sp.]|nr:type II secretion system F family protein [Sideroxyarcus sp.]
MQYEVKVLRGHELMAIVLEAADAADAEAQAKAQGYTVIAAKARQAWLSWRQRSAFPLVLFSQELVALLDAGLPLVEALEALGEKEEQPEVRKTLMQIIASLYEGHTFSHALAQSPKDFPALYVATVRASEKTGSLAEVLSRYIVYQSQMESIRRKVVTSSIYPVILAVVGGMVMLFLMMFVVPRFSHIYADIGSDLPLMSQLLMDWGQLLDRHWRLFLAGAAVGAGMLAFLFTQPAFRQWLEDKLWQLPALGKRMYLYQMARFYRSLGMLLRGGMPVLAALRLSGGLLRVSMRERQALAATSIHEGGSISQAMERHGLVTPLALRLLRVGERTGQMGEMMERIAAFYEDETARWVDRFIKLFEPLLMTFMGVVIGLVVVLMYFPIFELAGSLE